MATRIVIVVQARMGSTRFPGKIAKPVAGAPMLVRMLERLQGSRRASEIVVATTHLADDDAVVNLAKGADVPWFRGHPTDVLDRHVRAGEAFNADVVVKVPSDCPLIDPAIVDGVLDAYLAAPGTFDYVSNLHPATYPDGCDVEAMSMAALELAAREATRPFEREHTTPFLWDQPHRFRIGNVPWETGLDYSMTHRLTVDYPEDHALVAGIYDALWSPTQSGAPPIFSLGTIVELLEQRPDLYALNARYAGVNWYRHCLSDLRTVSADQTRFLEDPR